MSDAKIQQKKDIGTGTKYDSGKPEYHYISSIAMEELAKVLTLGAKKYAAHNWRGGFVWSRVISACFRHLYAWLKGETLDPETGLNHLAHAMCCLMFLLEFETTHKELDDRYLAISDDDKMLEDLEQREFVNPEIIAGAWVTDGRLVYQVKSRTYTKLYLHTELHGKNAADFKLYIPKGLQSDDSVK